MPEATVGHSRLSSVDGSRVASTNWRIDGRSVQSSVRPVYAVGRDCWPWWGPQTRSQSASQAITPLTVGGVS